MAGLCVLSDLELTGAIPFHGSPSEDFVRVRQCEVPEHLPAPSLQGPNWELDATRLLLRVPSLGRFLVSDGRMLDVEPAPDSSLEEMLPFVLGSGIGAILYQRGGMVLHAASVAVNGQAYAFCGPSGAGKSTLAAALCGAGCDFVSDDVLAVSLDRDGRPVIWPDGRQLKLFKTSIASLGLEGARGKEVRSGLGKHYVESPGGCVSEPLPLRSVFVLRDARPPYTPGLERLSPVDAAQALTNESYRPRLASALTSPARRVGLTGSILRHTSVFYLTRTRNLDLLGETAAGLCEIWRDAQAGPPHPC